MTKHLKRTLAVTIGYAVLMFLIQILREKELKEALIQSVLSALIFGVLMYFLNRKKEGLPTNEEKN